ncbi:MAG: Na/Pi cotransporter family protein [Erysipelotrichaceae bacterium]|nr:Na/Pi cotransporter family protein [Erysipelotrichaceae bacterium]
MNITSVLTLFGGLCMFLYGMGLMGDGLKDGSSGTLKRIMEKVTDSHVKAFLLGLFVTALIQSSNATILITAGLVAANILTVRQSLGIIVGANVGTTVTGQIIRLIDLDAGGAAGFLELFKPSTLAPVALIAGTLVIKAMKKKSGKALGEVLMGFGILFTGMVTMTGSVNSLADTGIFDPMFSVLDKSPVLGFLIGTVMSLVLQSASATVGILQAFSASGGLTFRSIYSVLAGIFLGVTIVTGILCSIGAKADQKRIGIINILFNIAKIIITIIGVQLLYRFGFLNNVWDKPINSGVIANTNTIANLVSAIIMLPFLTVFEKLAYRVVKGDVEPRNKYADKLDALNPAFYSTPALALDSCHKLLTTMFDVSRQNIEMALGLQRKYDEEIFEKVNEEEGNVDIMSDHLSNYLARFAGEDLSETDTATLNQYFKDVVEFERLSDLALDIAEEAKEVHEEGVPYPESIHKEIGILHELIGEVLDNAGEAFKNASVDAAKRIEPLEEVVDNLVNSMKENALTHLSDRELTIVGGTAYAHVLGYMERISDMCSNIGLATVSRFNPIEDHEYEENLLAGHDERFNREYEAAREQYFGRYNESIKNHFPAQAENK